MAENGSTIAAAVKPRRVKLAARPSGMTLPAPVAVNQDEPLVGEVSLGWLRTLLYSIGRAMPDEAVVSFDLERTHVQ